MPIHDPGYRHWSGMWPSHPYRWRVITKKGIGLLLKKKGFLALVILSAIPFLVRAVLLYLSSAIGRSIPMLQVNARFFEEFLTQQSFFTFIIAIYAGAGLISNDLRANALPLYLSKPITRNDYVMGKLGVLVFFLALPTFVPGISLYLLAILFQANLAYLLTNWWIVASITGYSLIIIFTYGFMILGFSSLSKSRRVAGTTFAAVVFFSQILYMIVSTILRNSGVAWVSLGNNLAQVGDVLFRMEPGYKSPAWVSLAILAALIVGAGWIVYSRVRAVEVVS